MATRLKIHEEDFDLAFRECLGCEKEFPSKNKYHRVCDPCKSNRDAPDYSEYVIALEKP